MAVRNYDRPDPGRVVTNLRKVLASGDMTLLQKGSYQFLITHCGFIAHYNQRGFIDTYRGDLPAFVATFLGQMGFGWDTFLENPSSYLYDVSYKGRMLADIIRELVPIFQAFQPVIAAAHADRQRRQSEAALRALADELGYTLVPKEEGDGQA